MNRGLGVVLFATILLPSLSLAGQGVQYSGISSMTFQNGVAPTAGYSGCTDTFLKSTDTGRDFGGNAYLRASGSGAAAAHHPLIKFDISALPDSAVIVRARLWFYQTSQVLSASSPILSVFRSFYPWTAGTGDSASSTAVSTWTTRVSGSNWATAGATKQLTNPTGGSWQSALTDTSTITAAYNGADSLDFSGSIGANDIPTDASAVRTPKASSNALSRVGWFSIDVTHQVMLWHTGANTNNGFVIWPDKDDFLATGVLYWCSSNYGYKLRRPKLEVTYFDPTSGTTLSSSGRRILGPAIKGVQ